jgi:general secretion pathway protein B
MKFINAKASCLFRTGLVVSTLCSPVLFVSSVFANTAISAGVQQTDPLTILKLADIEFKHPLSVVAVPTQQLVPIYTAKQPEMKVISSSKAKPDYSSEQLDMNEQLTMNDELAHEQVSAELLAKFNRALTATSDEDNVPANEVPESYNAVPIADLPTHLRMQIPDISYSSHVYSSKANNRSVRLNNRDLREGSWLSDDVEILEILQNEVIMRVGAQSFSLKALSDWSA